MTICKHYFRREKYVLVMLDILFRHICDIMQELSSYNKTINVTIYPLKTYHNQSICPMTRMTSSDHFNSVFRFESCCYLSYMLLHIINNERVFMQEIKVSITHHLINTTDLTSNISSFKLYILKFVIL